MPQITSQENQTNRSFLKAILLAWLIVGTLDITAAIIQTLIKGGNIIKMFQYIASGVFGKASFSGGLPFAFYGLVFHYCIAFGWTALFFLIYPKMRLLSKNKIITGLGYGFFVWLVMNGVVLPLSNVPQSPIRIFPAVLILMAAIGLPLSFMVNKFYSSDQNSK
jgi:hypothetical protein